MSECLVSLSREFNGPLEFFGCRLCDYVESGRPLVLTFHGRQHTVLTCARTSPVDGQILFNGSPVPVQDPLKTPGMACDSEVGISRDDKMADALLDSNRE